MATKTCRRFYKDYGSSSALCLYNSIFSRSTFLLKNLDKFFKSLVLSNNSILVLDAFPMTLFVIKYIEENLQCILKIVLKV